MLFLHKSLYKRVNTPIFKKHGDRYWKLSFRCPSMLKVIIPRLHVRMQGVGFVLDLLWRRNLKLDFLFMQVLGLWLLCLLNDYLLMFQLFIARKSIHNSILFFLFFHDFVLIIISNISSNNIKLSQNFLTKNDIHKINGLYSSADLKDN